MNAYDLATKLGCSVEKARRIARASGQQLDRMDEPTSRMIFHLSRREPLTLREHLSLLEEPSLISTLRRPYQGEARRQLAELGNWKATAAPKEVAELLGAAAANDPTSVTTIVVWLRKVVPPYAVSWHWVGVRLLGNVPAKRRKSYFYKAWLAFENCRLHPLFVEWCRKDASEYRNPIRVKRPNYDL